MFCREQFARVAAHAEAFDQMDIEMVAIGNGSGPFALDFLSHMGARGHDGVRTLVDPDRKVYASLGMKRTAFDLLKPRVWKASRRALASGMRQGATRGDPLQNGGVALIDTRGDVRFRHIEAHAGDLVDVNQLLDVTRRMVGL